MSQIDSAVIAQWVQAIGTIAGIFAGVFGLWWQLRKQWLLNSANIVSSLANEYTNDVWRKYRRHSARSLQEHLNGKQIDLSKDLPILGFFENMGHLVRRGGLDKEMIWNKFGWYIVRYYLALTYKNNLIEDIRRKEADPTLWEEWEWLNHEMLKIYQRRGVKILTDSALLVEENVRIRINELFEQELNLEIT